MATLLLNYVVMGGVRGRGGATTTCATRDAMGQVGTRLSRCIRLSRFLRGIVLTKCSLGRAAFSRLTRVLPGRTNIMGTFRLTPSKVVASVFPRRKGRRTFKVGVLARRRHDKSTGHTGRAKGCALKNPCRLGRKRAKTLLFRPICRGGVAKGSAF